MADRPVIRLAMIGGGPGSMIGAVHRFAARLDGHYELVAGAFSTNPAANRETATALGMADDRRYDDYHELLRAEAARPDGATAVAITTPNFLHYDMALAAIDAGMDVICEKPLTVSVEQAEALAERVQASGCRFLLTHNYCGYPLVQHARHLVQSGELGQLRTVQVEYVQDWLSEPAGPENRQAAWRLDPKRAGSAGALGDIGSHAFHLARFITGLTVDAVCADLVAMVPGRELDDNVHAMLRFAGGARGMLWASQTAPGHENALSIRVVGDRASLTWAQENPNELWLSPLNEPARRLTRRPDWLSDTAGEGLRLPPGHPEGYIEGFANLYSAFAGNARDQSWLPTVEDGVDGLRFIATCLQSSETGGAWVNWPGRS